MAGDYGLYVTHTAIAQLKSVLLKILWSGLDLAKW